MGGDPTTEFLALSAKVSDKTATDEERARWRELRKLLLPGAPKPIPAGQTPRAHPRSDKKLRVHFAPLTEMTITFTDEIGGGGLRLRAQKHFEPGTVLMVRIELQPAALMVETRVIWSRREGGHFAVGVEFVGLAPADAERLEALAHAKP